MTEPADAMASVAAADGADWDMVVGLETHVQLLTASKMFCGCSAAYDGAEPNTLVCPICLGLPGSLPSPNAAAVEHAVRTGLALGCRIATTTHFDRKNYHYPDLAKGYQISQYDGPLGVDGALEVMEDSGSVFAVGIERVHLEEDTAKSMHAGSASLVDYNRSGVPLLEIVTRPDLRSADQAKAYLESLRQLLRWIGVSTGNMEAGALRADVNVSIRPKGQTDLGVKVELKNLNSFAAVKSALEFERARLIDLVAAGGTVEPETRGWSEASGRSVPQRTKEFAEDYRYFPDPDLPPLRLDPAWGEQVRQALPELPYARRSRFMRDLGLGPLPARLLTRDAATADYFEAALAGYDDAPRLAGWITGPLFGAVRAAELDWDTAAERVPPSHLAAIAAIVDQGKVTLSAGREILGRIVTTGQDPSRIIAAEGLGQISDRSELEAVVAHVVASNPGPVADFCGGKVTAIGFLIGAVMRATRGQANAGIVRELLEAALVGACQEEAG